MELIKQAARFYTMASRAKYGEDATRHIAHMDRVTAQFAAQNDLTFKEAETIVDEYIERVAS